MRLDPRLWSCEKGSLKPLHRLKVNQTREIKEAHHRHRRKAAGDFEPPLPSRVCDRDVRQRDLRLSKRRRGCLEHQPKGLQHTQMKATGRPTPKIIFRM